MNPQLDELEDSDEEYDGSPGLDRPLPPRPQQSTPPRPPLQLQLPPQYLKRIHKSVPLVYYQDPDRFIVHHSLLARHNLNADAKREKTYLQEYNALRALNWKLYAEDCIRRFHPITYTLERGWHDPRNNIEFPYSSIIGFAPTPEETFNFIEHSITDELIPPCVSLYLPNKALPDSTLSVVITAYGGTNIKRFIFLLASFQCELMKPFFAQDYVDDEKISITNALYDRMLENYDLPEDLEKIDFNELSRLIIQTFPSGLAPMPVEKIQFILMIDNNGNMQGMYNITNVFKHFARTFHIRHYLIISPGYKCHVAIMRNIGIQYATNDFIILRDDDDISSSLDGILKKCGDYGNKWERNKILKMSCTPVSKAGNSGVWGLIIPQESKNLFLDIPTINIGDDTVQVICLMMAGALRRGDTLGKGDAFWAVASQIPLIHKILDGELFVEDTPPTKEELFKDGSVVKDKDENEVGSLYTALYEINIVLKLMLIYRQHYKEHRITSEQYHHGIMVLTRAISHYDAFDKSSSVFTDPNDSGTFMYLYINPSNSSAVNQWYIEPIRLITLLDYIDPNHPFHLVSPNELLNPRMMGFYDEQTNLEVWHSFITPENPSTLLPPIPPMDEFKNQIYIHPDEQRMLTVYDGERDMTRRESAWVTAFVGRNRKTPLLKTHQEIHEYNSRIKSDPYNMIHGGGGKKIFIYALIFILVLLIIVMFLRTFEFTSEMFGLNRKIRKYDESKIMM